MSSCHQVRKHPLIMYSLHAWHTQHCNAVVVCIVFADAMGTRFDYPVQYSQIGSTGCSSETSRFSSDHAFNPYDSSQGIDLLYHIKDSTSLHYEPDTKHSVTTCVKRAALYASYYTYVVTGDHQCFGGKLAAVAESTSSRLCARCCMMQ